MGKPQELCNSSATAGTHYQPQILRGEWGSGAQLEKAVGSAQQVGMLSACGDPPDRTRHRSPSLDSCQGPYWPNVTGGTKGQGSL